MALYLSKGDGSNFTDKEFASVRDILGANFRLRDEKGLHYFGPSNQYVYLPGNRSRVQLSITENGLLKKIISALEPGFYQEDIEVMSGVIQPQPISKLALK